MEQKEEEKVNNEEGQTNKEEENHEYIDAEMKISGKDVLEFLKRIFRAGNSRLAVFKDENGKKLFKINLILLLLICFIIPVIALVFVIILVAADYSVSIQKRK
ncbi:MAG: DUF4342 domain-containing protein [Candidatus Pacebacteria bacterium]|nr:DUF4342 domain-containing protein [Candidatus Paceibacterota bacterium]